MVDHDSTTNFVANEHINHTSVTITAGDGLTGGGTIASTRTLAVGEGTGVTVNANDVAIGQDVATTANVKFANITGSTISASADIIADSGSFSYLDIEGNLTSSVGHFDKVVVGSDGIDTAGDLTLDGDGGDIIFKDDGTEFGRMTQLLGSLTIKVGSSANNAIIFDGDGNQILGGTISSAHNISTTATASLAKISGSLIESTGDFTLNSSGDIILDADGTDIILKDGGTSFGSFKRASSDFIIKAETADKDILFKGTDDSTTITALQLDMSAGGNAQFLGNISGSQIEASGDVIAFGSSDRNLKDNIQPIENPLEKMDKIGGYTFVWNNKQSTYQGKDVGVVAQEIQEVLPEIVSGRANGYLGVKYEKIVPLLIESIKELKKEVEDIKQKCDCLNK